MKKLISEIKVQSKYLEEKSDTELQIKVEEIKKRIAPFLVSHDLRRNDPSSISSISSIGKETGK
jgi:hypothetical protein